MLAAGKKEGQKPAVPAELQSELRPGQTGSRPAPASSEETPRPGFLKFMCDTDHVQAHCLRMKEGGCKMMPHVDKMHKCCPGRLLFWYLGFPPLLGEVPRFPKGTSLSSSQIQEVFMGLVPFPGSRPGSSAPFTTRAAGIGSQLAQGRPFGPVSLSSGTFSRATRRAMFSGLQALLRESG